jgi:hypothetical protein
MSSQPVIGNADYPQDLYTAVATRRRWPLLALGAGAVAQVALAFAGIAFAQYALLAVALTAYTVARVKPARPARIALALVLVAFTLAALLSPNSLRTSLGFASVPVAFA